jgi:FkbM family methyltransferase
VKLVLTVVFMPLYGLFHLVVWTHLKLFGPLRAEAIDLRGARIACELPDFIQRHIYLFGIWEPHITDFVFGRLRTGDTFVDVGAHTGYYTLMASGIVGNQGRVIAIEASPRNYQMLQSNLALNQGLVNVRTVNIAVADSVRHVDLYSGPEYNLGMTSTYRRPKFRFEAVVLGAPLHDILKSEGVTDVRLIKIDVEGSEILALSNLDDLLQTCRDDAEFIIELSPDYWVQPRQELEQIVKAFTDVHYFPYVVRNKYRVWQYLWPYERSRPSRITPDELFELADGQIDVIFSRENCFEL